MSVRNLLASKSQLDNLPTFPLPCPQCGAPLLQTRPKKPEGSVTCPHCKKTATAQTALAKACELQALQTLSEERLSAFKAQIGTLKKRGNSILRFRLFTRFRITRQIAEQEDAASREENHLESLKTLKRACVLTAYYLSSWYKHTGARAARCFSTSNAKGIVPILCKGKILALAAGDADLGIAGEHAVYSLIKERTKDRNSHLFEAVVVPRAKLRCAKQQNGVLKLEEREVDCLVATRSCLFLREVKTADTHILASNRQERIAFSKQANVSKTLYLGKDAEKVTHRPFKKNSRIIQQSKDEVKAAVRSSLPYPASRIRRVVVFVEPRSFTNSDYEFFHNLFIGCVLGEKQTFLNALERESASHTPFIAQEELEGIGSDLQCSFSIVPAKQLESQAA